MSIEQIESGKFENIIKEPFTVFDSLDFLNLNSPKVDTIKHFVYSDSKQRFGFSVGVKDQLAKAPFSSPFSCFSKLSSERSVSAYGNFIQELCEILKQDGISKLKVTLPPSIYDEDHISKISNALYINQFNIAGCDLNYHYSLELFDQNYDMSIDPKARQKLRASLKNDLSFTKTDDFKSVYSVIYENRKFKGYPLWMSLEDLINTSKIVEIDCFMVQNAEGPLAAAIIYKNKKSFAQVIYWGNAPGTDALKPMNFMSYKIFEYYSKSDVTVLDIGPSTEFSIPNIGLCDFKQGIGCKVSTKLSFEKSL